MLNLANIVQKYQVAPDWDADWIAVAAINFKSQNVLSELVHIRDGDVLNIDGSIYFDLASLTKPLTLALLYHLHSNKFTHEMKLLLSHAAGLPSWGLVSKHNWKNQIESYPIKESKQDYSDFSPMRLYLELSKLIDVKKECEKIWDKEVCFWKDLPHGSLCPITGVRNQKPIIGEVHDPNAYVIGEMSGHAGLFGTINGVAQTLLILDRKTDFVNLMARGLKNITDQNTRFVHGWDRVQNEVTTLAGSGASLSTFGHLGFTGTSIWIDADKKIGHIILSNATKKSWYHKVALNQFRKEMGQKIWSLTF